MKMDWEVIEMWRAKRGFVFCSAVLLGLSYSSASCLAQEISPFKLDASEPAIYVTYEKEVPSGYQELDSRAWLRLKNNSRWGIWVNVSSGPRNWGGLRVYYDLVDTRTDTVKQGGCHVCSPRLIKSGESLLFTVSKSHIKNKYELRFEFWYEWESEQEGVFPLSNESIHFARFSFETVQNFVSK